MTSAPEVLCCQESPTLHLLSLVIIIMSCLCLRAPGSQRSGLALKAGQSRCPGFLPRLADTSFPQRRKRACSGHLPRPGERWVWHARSNMRSGTSPL